MTFGESIQTCFAKFGNFDDRGSRSEFWWFYLFSVLAGTFVRLTSAMIGYLVGGHISAALNFAVSSIIISLVFVIPSLAASSRRLHDTNRSAWWILISITGVGIIPLIMWWAQKGDPHPNRFGPEPEAWHRFEPAEEQAVDANPATAAGEAAPAAAKAARGSRKTADPKVAPAAPQPAYDYNARAHSHERAPSSSNGVLIAVLVVVALAAIGGLAYVLKFRGDEEAPVAEVSASASTEPSADDPAPARKHRAVRHERTQAGDVSIDEGSDGHSRIRAGDIVLDD